MRNPTNRRLVSTAGLVVCLALMFTSSAWAGKGGKGGGKGGDDGGDDITPAIVTFADQMGSLGHGVGADAFGAYVHGIDGVEAYLGNGGALGDIFLRLAEAPGRGLWFDFGNCHPNPASCTPPFDMGVDYLSAIAVAPGDIVANGLFGMAAGDTIEAPMEFWYNFGNSPGPGWVYFDRNLKGKNPCRNKSLHATITRPGEAESWVVSANAATLACVTLPGGALSGQYDMTFEFTIETLPQ
jgi:hypothetical protein